MPALGYTYQAERRAALKAIQKYGAQVMLLRNDGNTYECHAVIDQYSAMERITSQIQFTDRKIILAALEIDPIIPDVETDRLFAPNQTGDIPPGSTLRLIAIRPIAPGGVNVLFEMQARL